MFNHQYSTDRMQIFMIIMISADLILKHHKHHRDLRSILNIKS